MTVSNDLVDEIMRWGREKGIDNPQVQLKKLCEEALETQDAYSATIWNPSADWAERHLLEEVGDIGVVWLLLCQALDIKPEDALDAAHEKNKDRKGRTVNGNFIKDEE